MLSGPSGTQGSAATPRTFLSVRVGSLDYYQTPGERAVGVPDHVRARNRRGGPPLVPTVVVWGATPAGQKACVHVHGVYPWLRFQLPLGTDAAAQQGPLADALRGPDDALFTAALLAEVLGKLNASVKELRKRCSCGDVPPADRGRRTVRTVNVEMLTPFYGCVCACCRYRSTALLLAP